MRTPKIGEKIKLNKDTLNPDKIYKIVELIYNLLSEKEILYVIIKEFNKKGSPKIKVSIDDITYIEAETLSGEEKHKLLDKFVKADFLPDFTTRHKELGVLNRLIKAYPNLDFWRNFNPNFQVKSLLWWFGGGKKDLIVAYNYFTLNLTTPQKVVSLQSEKIGEDVQINKKPKTFLDLLI